MEFREKLERLIKDLLDASLSGEQGASTVDLDQSRVGRLSRMDALQNQAMSKNAQAQREQQLRDAKAALKRINSNTFGYCLNCDEAINPLRLEHNPAVSLCITCAQDAEK